MTESAAAIVQDGVVTAAAEEERFSRTKHQGGVPYLAIESVLAQTGLKMGTIDVMAVYWDPYKLGYRTRYMTGLAFSNPGRFIQKLGRGFSVWRGSHAEGEEAGWSDMFRLISKMKKRFGAEPKSVKYFDHHLTHMASCFYGSEFDEAAILIMDGAGEAACTTTAIGRGTKIEVIDQHLLPHSLGHFYSAITGYLGFKMLDGEYKLMGLSPYGDPSSARWMRENFLVTLHPGRYALLPDVLDYHEAIKGNFRGRFTEHYGEPRVRSETAEFNDRHRDIAASTQRAFDEVVLDLADNLRNTTGLDKLVIAGGCGLNCVANGQVLRHGIFDEIYVPPVPHDSGGAMGAAMCAWRDATGKRPTPVKSALLGPSFTTEEVERVLNASQDRVEFIAHDEEVLCAKAAERLAAGDVLAWFQGAMEYGPRALGNRSFLADPRSDSIRDALNTKIKKRELFRPFAPSVKEEKATEYFDIEQSAPFMTIIVPVKDQARETIPAVTHVDGTARPQTVGKDVNPRYWKLLDAFERETGVACLLNTSFNIQEPIVCTPQEAVDTFCRSQTDVLILNEYWVTQRKMA